MRKIYEAGDVFRRIIYNRTQMAPQSSSSDAVPSGSPIRKRLLTLLKISITVLGLIIVIKDIDFQALLAYMSEIDWAWMAVGAGLIGISLVIRTYRWHILLSGAGSKVRFSRLLSLYLIGSFFNAFLPSGLGGDVVRAAEAAQDVESSVAVGTVLVDRLTGLMALFMMALVVLPFRPPEFPDYLAVTIAGICISGLMLGFVLVDGRLFFWFIHHLPGAVRQLGGGFISRLATSIQNCGGRTLTKALLVSMLFNLVQVGWWATAGRALGLAVPYTYFLLVVPIMSLALLVPSIGGLGVREFLSPIIFRGAGLSPEQSVALTLLVFGLERVASLLGAPVYIYSTIRAHRREQPTTDDSTKHDNH